MNEDKLEFSGKGLLQPSGKLGNVSISLILFLVLVVMTVTVFSDVFSHTFIDYDDQRVIVDRIDAYDGLTLDNIKKIFIEDYPREEPLIVRDLSYLVNASIFGALNPQGFLLGNLFLHIIASYFVYLICLQLFPANYGAAAFSALLFCVHPVHVESIAWISSRKDPLYGVFFLWGVLRYTKFFSEEKEKLTRHLIVSFLLFCCALFSKSAAVSFLPVILCYRYCFYRSYPVKLQEITYLLALLLSTLFFISWYSGVLQDYGVVEKGFSFDRNWIVWFFTTIATITFYLTKLVYPVNLSIVYDYPSAGIIFTRVDYLLYSFVVCGVVAASLFFFWRKKKNVLLFYGLFFFCTLLPYLDLIQVDIFVADRYLYLASISFCLVLALVFMKGFNSAENKKFIKYFSVVAAVSTLTLFAVQTKTTTRNWQNTFTFWNNAHNVAPTRIEPYSGLMREYVRFYIENYQNRNGRLALDEARKIGQAALDRFCKSDQECPVQLDSVLTYLAEVDWQQNKIQEADHYFMAALKTNPNYHDGRFMYASFLIEQKEYHEALLQLKIIEERASFHKDKRMLDDIRTRLRPIIRQNTTD